MWNYDCVFYVWARIENVRKMLGNIAQQRFLLNLKGSISFVFMVEAVWRKLLAKALCIANANPDCLQLNVTPFIRRQSCASLHRHRPKTNVNKLQVISRVIIVNYKMSKILPHSAWITFVAPRST